MGGSKRFKGDNEGLYLPEPIIHRILSFLDARQAAQAALVSKAWHSAWLIRPDLVFDDQYFRTLDPLARMGKSIEFWNFATETMQRYQDLNLRVDTVRLVLETANSGPMSLSTEFITQVVQMGVKEILMHFPARNLVDDQHWLPSELLEAENLVRLSVRNWRMDKPSAGMVNHSKLKSLTLEQVDNLGGDCFSLMFPCLEDLKLKQCRLSEPLRIVSSSLKFFTFESITDFLLRLDVPNLRKLKYSSYSRGCLPTLNFTTVSTEMVSDISLLLPSDGPIFNGWFIELKSFNKSLSGSKVSLHIHGKLGYVYENKSPGNQGPLVENLTLSITSRPSSYRHFLAGLFWSCPPKFITVDWFPSCCVEVKEKASNEFVKFLCRELMCDLKSCTMNLIGDRDHDLGEVKLECFDSSLATWQPFPWRTVLSDSVSPKTREKFRFKLEWCGITPPLRHAA